MEKIVVAVDDSESALHALAFGQIFAAQRTLSSAIWQVVIIRCLP